MTRSAVHQPLVSGLIFLDHAPGTSGELEVDWSSAPWASEVPAALPRRRAKRRGRAKRRRPARASAPSGFLSGLSRRVARSAQGAGFAGLADLPKRLSSRFSASWTGALAAAGIQLCPACRSRNHYRATFCNECHVTLREVPLTGRRPAASTPRSDLAVHAKVALALALSLLFAVFLTALAI